MPVLQCCADDHEPSSLYYYTGIRLVFYQTERKAPDFSHGDRSESFKGGLGGGDSSRHTLFRAKRIASLSEVRPKCALMAATAWLSCSVKRIGFAFCIP